MKNVTGVDRVSTLTFISLPKNLACCSFVQYKAIMNQVGSYESVRSKLNTRGEYALTLNH